MKTPLFTGSAVAIVTPFTSDFVDFDKLGELIEAQIAGGTDAIVVCGTTGEASTQTIPEHLATVEYVTKKVDHRVKVIAGTGSNDTAHALMMSQNAEKSGVDGLLMVTPYYNKTTQHGVVKHFEYIADRVGIPIVLYNIPERTGMSIGVEAYRELSKHPNINGTKDSTHDFDLLMRTLDACGDDLNIWSGNDSEIVLTMALGGKGIISVLANIMPVEIKKLADLCLQSNFPEAAKLQLELHDLITAMFYETNPVPVKTAMNLMGKNVGGVRMPLCDMLPANVEKLRAVMAKHGLIG